MRNSRLFNLLASNARKGAFSAEGNTIYLYDMIVGSEAEAQFFGGVSAERFVQTLRGMSGDISLRINSPGGDVFAARAMSQAMREHDGKVTAHIDGYAASAASLVAVSADRRIAAPGSMIMIHKAWTLAIGNSDDMLATADLLDKIDAMLADTYAARAGGAPDEWAAMMAAETWLTAQEALDLGLINELADEAAVKSHWDLTAIGGPAPHETDNRDVKAMLARLRPKVV